MRFAATSQQQHTSPALGARLGCLARRAWRAYWRRRAREATIVILRALDERTLRDIGISPSEIESCVYDKGERRHRYDERWAGR